MFRVEGVGSRGLVLGAIGFSVLWGKTQRLKPYRGTIVASQDGAQVLEDSGSPGFRTARGVNIGALVIRIGFWGILIIMIM